MIKRIIRKSAKSVSVEARTLLAKRGLFFSENDRRLWALRDKHRNQPAVIIGMGPSLLPGDLSRFEDFVSFACNKVYLGFEDTSWRPNYYSVIDTEVIENIKEEIQKIGDVVKIFSKRDKPNLLPMEDSLFFDRWGGIGEKNLKDSPRYTDNPLKGVLGGGGTVLLPLIQAAYWMGCDPVYVVGLDFSFNLSKKTGEKSDGGEVILEGEGERNHFHPDYRPKGEKWTAPRFESQIAGFRYARQAYEAKGRTLLNASRQTKLEELECRDFESIFKSP